MQPLIVWRLLEWEVGYHIISFERMVPLIRSWIGELGVKAEVRLPEADGFNWYVNHHK